MQDAPTFAGWATDPEFCRQADWTASVSFADNQRFHENLVGSPPRDLIRLGAIQEGMLVGYVDLHGNEPHRRELGFVIGPRGHWGRGLGLLAGAAGLSYGFGYLGLKEIWAEALDANQRSVRILQHLGMMETSRGDGGSFLERPTYYRQFAITAEGWASSRTH